MDRSREDIHLRPSKQQKKSSMTSNSGSSMQTSIKGMKGKKVMNKVKESNAGKILDGRSSRASKNGMLQTRRVPDNNSNVLFNDKVKEAPFWTEAAS